MQMRFVILFGLLLVLPVGGLRAQAPEQSSQPATAVDDPDEFGQRVRSYLLRHPEVLMEAAQILQERQRAALVDQVKQTIAARSDEIFRDPSSPVGGNPNGDVVLVEFFDYNCKYCKAVAPTVADLRSADPALRLVYKEFPILGPGSVAAAKVALAAHRQGNYQKFHEQLMNHASPVDEAVAMQAAAAVGLDLDRLKRDMADPAIAEAIARNQARAAALGINGTPGFVLADQVVPGAVDRATLEGLIARARGKNAGASP